MTELLQTLIRPLWQLFMPIPMPWRSVIILLLLMPILSWLFLRAFPWLFTQVLKLLILIKLPQLILNLAQFVARILLLPEYLITQSLRKRGFQPPHFIYIFDDLITWIVNTINQACTLLDKILKKGNIILNSALKIRWMPRRKYSFLLAVFLLFLWFIRPQLDEKNTFAILIDRGVNSWYSLENWIINGELKSTILNQTSPQEFIKDYFSAINTQRYTIAWNSLSPEYKIKKSGSYKNFLEWWEKKVERVDLHGVSLKSHNARSATINISLQYLMRDPKKLSKTELISYQLIWDVQEKRWLINDSDYLSK
jgi:hypothetical protein